MTEDLEAKRRWLDFLLTPFRGASGERIDPLVEIGAQPPGDSGPSMGLIQTVPATPEPAVVITPLPAEVMEQFIAWAASGTTRWDALPVPVRPEIVISHARELPDRTVLALISQLSTVEYWPWAQHDKSHWVSRWDLAGILRLAGFRARHGDDEMPQALVRAKAARLIDRGLLSGCTCGCRGDFELTAAGTAFIDHEEER